MDLFCDSSRNFLYSVPWPRNCPRFRNRDLCKWCIVREAQVGLDCTPQLIATLVDPPRLLDVTKLSVNGCVFVFHGFVEMWSVWKPWLRSHRSGRGACKCFQVKLCKIDTELLVHATNRLKSIGSLWSSEYVGRKRSIKHSTFHVKSAVSPTTSCSMNNNGSQFLLKAHFLHILDPHDSTIVS